ncbi:putative glycoporin [Vibrio ishigakensis]|uniref:Putative glycoporin n=1 Tax=Vibrio ishigakensis TaxID=1481914 RepID=A0A0B8Q6L9_9VIBR|nr:putative glycoporin [Vibrio ishigakensis]
MKEAHGRGSDGQIMYNQSFGNLYLELATMIGDRSSLFADSYQGVQVDRDNVKDSFLVRLLWLISSVILP